MFYFNVSSTKYNCLYIQWLAKTIVPLIVSDYKVAQTIIAMLTEDKVTESRAKNQIYLRFSETK